MALLCQLSAPFRLSGNRIGVLARSERSLATKFRLELRSCGGPVWSHLGRLRLPLFSGVAERILAGDSLRCGDFVCRPDAPQPDRRLAMRYRRLRLPDVGMPVRLEHSNPERNRCRDRRSNGTAHFWREPGPYHADPEPDRGRPAGPPCAFLVQQREPFVDDYRALNSTYLNLFTLLALSCPAAVVRRFDQARVPRGRVVGSRRWGATGRRKALRVSDAGRSASRWLPACEPGLPSATTRRR